MGGQATSRGATVLTIPSTPLTARAPPNPTSHIGRQASTVQDSVRANNDFPDVHLEREQIAQACRAIFAETHVRPDLIALQGDFLHTQGRQAFGIHGLRRLFGILFVETKFSRDMHDGPLKNAQSYPLISTRSRSSLLTWSHSVHTLMLTRIRTWPFGRYPQVDPATAELLRKLHNLRRQKESRSHLKGGM